MAVPDPVPTWFKPWVKYKLLPDVFERPPGAPERIEDWAHAAHRDFVRWGRWKASGEEGQRPDVWERVPQWAWDLYGQRLVREKLEALGPLPQVIIPFLGPITPDGPRLLDYDPTHLTSGLGWPALDAGWRAGKAVLAPEPCRVYDNTSSSQGGDAFYVRGEESGCPHWVAHIVHVPELGRRFARGERMTTISSDHREPHVHWAMDARPLIGSHLKYGRTGAGPNYTHGSPTIGEQLEAALA